MVKNGSIWVTKIALSYYQPSSNQRLNFWYILPHYMSWKLPFRVHQWFIFGWYRYISCRHQSTKWGGAVPSNYIRYVRSKISEKEITNLELIWANRSEVDNTSVTLKVTLKTGLYHKVSALYEWDLQFEKWSLPYGIHFLSVWSAIWLVAFTGSIADFLVRHGRENVEFFFRDASLLKPIH